MQRILFICYGNICRSTMAESVFTELVRRAGRAGEFVIDSAATSTEEIGNPPHHGTVAKLREVGIPVVAHRARQVRRAEYGDWDHIVYMDAENARGGGGGEVGGAPPPENKGRRAVCPEGRRPRAAPRAPPLN